MTRFLLNCAWLALVLLQCRQPAHGQYILAGQTTGAAYTDIVPDKVLTAKRAGPTTATTLLDLNGDGQADIQVTAYVSAASFPNEAEARVQPLHDDVAIYSPSQAPVIIGFATKDSIQQRMPQPRNLPGLTIPPNLWAGKSTIYPYAPSYLTHTGNNPGGIQSYGYWIGGQDTFLAVRLRATASAGWQYGWVRIQVTNTTDSVLITIKDYAFVTSSQLPVLPPAITAGWQIYPTLVRDQLIIQSPPNVPGSLTITDSQGQLQLSTQLAAGVKLPVDLSALSTGMYILYLRTPAGSFSQRLVKQ